MEVSGKASLTDAALGHAAAPKAALLAGPKYQKYVARCANDPPIEHHSYIS